MMAKKTNEAIRPRRTPLYISVKQLFLDPENPRLPKEAQGKDEDELQEILFRRFNLEELAYSMAENGYFDEEPLVVIPQRLPKSLVHADSMSSEYQKFIGNETTRFTVVEGNRRVAAVKLLLNQELRKKFGIKTWPKLSDAVANNLSQLPAIVYSKRHEIVSYLGVRHLIGILKWEYYERASHIAAMVQSGQDISHIEQQIGDRHRSARKLYFSYRLIEEVETEFDLDTDKAKNYFSYLVLSTGQGAIKDFLGIPRGWNAVDFKKPVPKKKLENLKYLFSWLFGEGPGKPPVIRESRDITNKLSPVLRNKEATEYLKSTRDLDEAYERSDGEKELLLKNLRRANKNIERSLGLVPQYKTDEVKEEVRRCYETLSAILKLLED
jgi:hypothetical protein